jgi:hypothetical protein
VFQIAELDFTQMDFRGIARLVIHYVKAVMDQRNLIVPLALDHNYGKRDPASIVAKMDIFQMLVCV